MQVDADRVRFAHIFTNLLANAAKYTDPGGTIALRVRCDNERVRVTISDNGAAREAGFDAHLTKPVNLQQVLELLHEHSWQQPASARAGENSSPR